MCSRCITFGMFLSVALAGSTQAQSIRYVDDDAPLGGNGLSWSTAYNDLQDALTEALGDPTITDIRVAGGTYVPSLHSEPRLARTETFQLINGVTLAGGYRGCPGGDCLGGDPGERDIEVYETVLTGDLNGDDGPSFENNGENSYHVVIGCGTDDTTILDGFTITGGNANGSSGDDHDRGGGIFNDDGDPTIANTTIKANLAESSGYRAYGGGMYNRTGSPSLTDCIFAANLVYNHDDRAYGGGMANISGNPTLTRCVFTDNKADSSDGYTGGGGLANFDGNPTLDRCTFVDNAASSTEGRVFGGALYNSSGSPTLDGCTFLNNSASSTEGWVFGGALYNGSGSPTLDGCTFLDNSASSTEGRGFGGALYNSSGSPTLDGCTFFGNSADTDSTYGRAFGGALYNSGNAMLTNCTFIENCVSAPERAYGGGIYNSDDATFANCTFIGNSVQGDWVATGGGMCNSGASPTLANCTFDGNSSIGPSNVYGGGMSNDSDSSPTLIGCRFIGNSSSGSSKASGGGMYSYYRSNPTLINCIFSGNSAARGGGMYNYYSGSATLTNCMLVGNSATEGGGLRNYGSIAVVTNCILWANGGSAEANQLDTYEGWTLVNYSTIQGLTGALGGVGNIGDDPLFVDADGPDDMIGTQDDDVRLLPNSPCIDAGSNLADIDPLTSGVQALPPADIAGNPRLIDILSVPDTGLGTPPVVDMGAFEHLLDCNGNGVPDNVDITMGTSEDCNANGIPEECEADCNENGIPDACEPECNGNGVPDDCDIAAGTSPDCNNNTVPDECDITEGTSQDCTDNGVPDECEVDCNDNGIADSCDLADGTSEDCNQDGIPDECLTYKTDCNNNDLVDECETTDGITPDVNGNGLPDECEPTVLFVDGKAAGLNNGTTWADAFNDLQDALSVAADSSGFVEEIWVAVGTYKPAGLGESQAATFQLTNGVRVYGGFAGDEKRRDQRVPDVNETILSGDLNGDDDPEPVSNCCTADQPGGCDDLACKITVCAEISRCCTEGWDETCALRAVVSCCETCGKLCDNSYHVVTGSDTDETTLLDGFTIRDGYAGGEGAYDDRGGGMLVVRANPLGSTCPVISNCTFADNTAQYGGGGMYVGGYEGGSTLTECTFIKNTARNGGGMLNGRRSSPILADCLFTENSGGMGGGMTNWGGSPVLSNCMFRRNSAGGGGGMSNMSNDDATLTGCTFAENWADYGGGMHNMCFANPTLNNCIFTGNSARVFGGGMYNDFCVPGPGGPVANCTFTGNSAGVSGGGVYNSFSDGLTLVSSIFWGNDDRGGTDESGQIHIEDSTTSIGNCCIEGWTGQLGGTGNIGDDPEFVDADGPDDIPATEDDNVRLSTGSPCINAGDNTSVPDDILTDLDGHARILCGQVDMGAYEFGIGDYDCDQTVDLTDFANWTVCITAPDNGPYDAGCEAFDFEFDGDVDLHDFALFQVFFEGLQP